MARIVLADRVVLYDRVGWGHDGSLPRLGYFVERTRRTHEIMHHSVAIDNDATPNFWENETEVREKMRQLQTIRPDLGLDVPYNYVLFLMNQPHKYLVICEGRGLDRTGAHTHGHNTAGIGICWEGDFHNYAVDVGPWILQINQFNSWLKKQLPNLGVVHPPGHDVYNHQDFAQTACAGDSIRRCLSQIVIEEVHAPTPTCEEKLDYALAVVKKIEEERVYAVAIAKELNRRLEKAQPILYPTS